MSLYKKLDKSLVISTYILLLIPTVLFFLSGANGT